jgi:hypothetical protein
MFLSEQSNLVFLESETLQVLLMSKFMNLAACTSNEKNLHQSELRKYHEENLLL